MSDTTQPQQHISPSDLLTSAQLLQGLLKQAGASQFDILLEQGEQFEVKVADGRIVTLQQAQNRSLGVRVFTNHRLGFASSADFTPTGLTQLAADVVQLSRLAEPVPHHDLPAITGNQQANPPTLHTIDEGIAKLSTAEKIAWAHELEAGARAESKHIRTFRDSGVATSIQTGLLLTSSGATRTYASTNVSMWCSPLAGAGEQQQIESDYALATHLRDLPSPKALGAKAAQRAVRMMGAKSIASRRCTILMEPRFAASWIGDIVGACNGDRVSKGASFLCKHLHKPIANTCLTIQDEPHLSKGLGSTLYDGEGMPTQLLPIVTSGHLSNWLVDSTTARKTGWQPTGHGQRSSRSLPYISPFNIRVTPGAQSLPEMIANCSQGLLVTRGLGAGLNPISGDYSRGINGIWIENGQLTYPVQEVTIAGNAWDMLKQLEAVGSEVEVYGTIGCPALRIEGMTVSGS